MSGAFLLLCLKCQHILHLITWSARLHSATNTSEPPSMIMLSGPLACIVFVLVLSLSVSFVPTNRIGSTVGTRSPLNNHPRPLISNNRHYKCRDENSRLYVTENDDPNPINTTNEATSPFSQFSSKLSSIRGSISLPNLFVGLVLGVASSVLAALVVLNAVLQDPSTLDGNSLANAETSLEKIDKQTVLFGDILMSLDRGYVDKVDQRKLFETAVTAMLKTLDPYTEFEDKQAAKSMQETVSGKYAGVGMVIAERQRDNINKQPAVEPESSSSGKSNNKRLVDPKVTGFGGVSVVDTFEGFAFDAGVRVSDRILSVDGIDTRTFNAEQVRNLLRGALDTTAQVVVQREIDGREQTLSIDIPRKIVHVSDVRLATLLGKPKDGIGYISLSGFNSNAGSEFRTALLMLRFTAPEGLKGLVVDLRGNPGGLLDAAVEIASYLVPKGSEIVRAIGRDGTETIYRSAIDPIRPPGTRLVVMVDGGSASASEIVAGAIQDLDMGVIMGASKTYGKGLVQRVDPLPFDAGALKYTVAKYYTPSRRCIQAIEYNGGRDTSSGEETGQQLQKQDAPVSSSGRGSSNSKSTSGGLLSDGAVTIKDVDRNIFYTTSGREVRDGGGIEPDISLPPNKLSPGERAVLSQGLMTDYLNQFLKTEDGKDVRNVLRTAVEEERDRLVKDQFSGYAAVKDINSLYQYFVLPSAFPEVLSNAIDSQGVNSRDESDGTGINSRFERVVKSSSSKLYESFKTYLNGLVKEGKADLLGSQSAELNQDIAELKEDIKRLELGPKSLADQVDTLRPSIEKSILQDMDAHKKEIVDDIQMGLLSRELPDRLLLYRAVTADQQVLEVTKFLREGSLPKAASEKVSNLDINRFRASSTKNGDSKVDPDDIAAATYFSILHPPSDGVVVANSDQ